jgi:hypothetical protein
MQRMRRVEVKLGAARLLWGGGFGNLAGDARLAIFED